MIKFKHTNLGAKIDFIAILMDYIVIIKEIV